MTDSHETWEEIAYLEFPSTLDPTKGMFITKYDLRTNTRFEVCWNAAPIDGFLGFARVLRREDAA